MRSYRWITSPTVTIDVVARELVLNAPLGWEGPDGETRWLPDGFRWNGSSIPRAAWSLVGHPFQPEYLYASALHDAECAAQAEDSDVVHRRFYYALRASGVPWRTAHAKYLAVREFGPQFAAHALPTTH